MKKVVCLLVAWMMVFGMTACSVPEPAELTASGVETTEPVKQAPAFEDGQMYTVQKLTAVHGQASADGGQPYSTRTIYEYEENRLVRSASYIGEALREELTYDGSIDRTLTEIWYDEDGSLMGRWACAYDENGNLASRQCFNEEGLCGEEIYTYDLQGNLLQFTEVSEGEELQRLECAYDDQGNRLEEKIIMDGVVYRTVTYVYDEHYRLQEKIMAYTGETETWSYDYDAAGNLIAVQDGESRWSCTYDEQGRLVKVISEEDGLSDVQYQYDYDAQGNIIREASLGDEWSYRYDEDGNLTGFDTCFPSGSQETRIEFETVTVSADVARELKKVVDSLYNEPIFP